MYVNTDIWPSNPKIAPYTFGIPRISHASFTRYLVGKLSLPSRTYV